VFSGFLSAVITAVHTGITVVLIPDFSSPPDDGKPKKTGVDANERRERGTRCCFLTSSTFTHCDLSDIGGPVSVKSSLHLLLYYQCYSTMLQAAAFTTTATNICLTPTINTTVCFIATSYSGYGEQPERVVVGGCDGGELHPLHI